jgi:hypothetical protein
MAIGITKKNMLRITISFILILTIALTQALSSVEASTTSLNISVPAVSYTLQARSVTFTDADLPVPPGGITAHWAPAAGEIGPGKILLSYQGQPWAIWLGVTDGKLWAYNIPQRSGLPPDLQAFYDSLAIDQNTVYTPQDGKNWFTGLPPWLNISKYDPQVTALPTFIAINSTVGQATIDYFITTGSSTTTALTSSANPSISGQSVTFTATLSGGSSPTGTVDFKDGVTTIASGVALIGVTAAYSTSTLSVGSHSITAVYNGDSNNTSSTSYTLTQVSSAPAAPALSSPSAGANIAGNSVTFTWSSIPGGVWYELQVSLYSDFSVLYHYNGGAFTTFTYNDLPNNGSTVYWRVRANNGIWSGWSAARSFVNGP